MLIAVALPPVCALCIGIYVVRALKLVVLGVFGNDRCVSDANNTVPRDCHASGQPVWFRYSNSEVGIRVGVQLPKALTQVACIAGSGWSGDQ